MGREPVTAHQQQNSAVREDSGIFFSVCRKDHGPAMLKNAPIVILDEATANVDPENDREAIQKKDDIIITKNCKCTTVIVECGFLSNETECLKLAEEEYQTKLAEAIKTGIDQYFTVMTPEESPKK